MRYIILLLSISILFSCKKEIKTEKVKPSTVEQFPQPTMAASLTDTAHLYIPENELGYYAPNYNGGEGLTAAGLWSGAKYATIRHQVVYQYFSDAYFGKLSVGSTVKVVNYPCDVANGKEGDTWDTTYNNPITLSGVADFVDSSGLHPVILSITTYAHGDVFLGRKKDQFNYVPSFGRLGAPQGINYHGTNSFLWWGWVDRYWNDAVIPDEDGKFVIAVTAQYGAVNPKTSLLPFNVSGDVLTLDTTAIAANTANVATNYKATIVRGRTKGVNVTWEGNGYAYCIQKYNETTGVWDMPIKWYEGRSWFDVDGTKFSRYIIITRAQGRIPDNQTTEFRVTK